MKKTILFIVAFFVSISILLAGCVEVDIPSGSSEDEEGAPPEDQLGPGDDDGDDPGDCTSALPHSGEVYEEGSRLIYWEPVSYQEAQQLKNKGVTSEGNRVLDTKEFPCGDGVILAVKLETSFYEVLPGGGEPYNENGRMVYWTLISEQEAQQIRNNGMRSSTGKKALKIREFTYGSATTLAAKWEK